MNYEDRDLVEYGYSEKLTKDDKKGAIKAFSRCHSSLVWYSFIATAVIYILQIALSFLVSAEQLSALAESPYYVWGMQVLSMYVIAFPLFLLMLRSLPKATRSKSDISLKEFIYIFLVSEAIMIAGSLFSSWLLSVIEARLGHQIADTTSDIIMQTPLWLVIAVVVIIGPIVEEMIFRKTIIDRLSIYGDRLAVVVSAFAFGLFHGNLYQLFYATALGLVLGYVYTKTRRSVYNCLLHMAINFMGTVPSILINDSLQRLNALPEDAVIEGSLIYDYALVTAVSCAIYLMAIAGVIVFVAATVKRAYRFSDRCDIRIPAHKLARVVVFNAGTVFFLIVYLLQCILSLFITA